MNELMKILYAVHKKGYLLLDLNPSNFTLRTINENEILFVKDLQNCYKIDSQVKINSNILTEFTSINYLKGKELTIKDDFECGFYVLMYVFKGILPWNGKERD